MYIKYTMNGVVQGRAISIGDLKTALDKSYSKTKVKTGFGDFEVDADLTTKETQTYVNKKSGQVLVVHRGTHRPGGLHMAEGRLYAHAGIEPQRAARVCAQVHSA